MTPTQLMTIQSAFRYLRYFTGHKESFFTNVHTHFQVNDTLRKKAMYSGKGIYLFKVSNFGNTLNNLMGLSLQCLYTRKPQLYLIHVRYTKLLFTLKLIVHKIT